MNSHAAPDPDPDADDPVERLAEELLEDPELFQEPTSGATPEGAGLTWIRSTLRTGGDADDALVGTLFHGKYRILRKIGAGGFGAVYEALDERGAHNRVALKIMLPSVVQSDEPLEVFRGEAVRVTRLNHPNIVDWKSFDRTPDGSYYFVMELLEGEDLQTVLKREGALDWKRSVRILLQILGALRAAHFVGEGQSILHLDLKPKNILLLPERRSRPETAKVIDFGIGQYLGGEELGPVAKAQGGAPPPVPAERPESFSTVTKRTDPARVFERRAAAFPFKISQACTPEYASPEHCVHIEFADGAELEPRPLDGRSDLYSFGVIAYQLLCGRLPFEKPAHRFQYLELHQHSPIEAWGAAESTVPRRLRQFVERCLEKDPDQRWSDAQEAYEALERIARPPARRWLGAVAVGLVLAGVLLSQLFTPRQRLVSLLEGHSSGSTELSLAHLGPASSELLVRLRDDASGELVQQTDDLQLLDAEGAPLEGWRVRRSGTAGELSILPPADFEASHPGRAVLDGLRLSDDKQHLFSKSPLRLVWLGSKAWQHELTAAGQVLATGAAAAPILLDPQGLELELILPEIDGDDLERGSLRFDCDERAMRIELRTRGRGVGLVCEFDELEDGPHRASIEAADLAGGHLRLEFDLVARSDGPSIETFAAPLGAPQVEWREGRSLVLSTGRAAELVLRSAGAARLTCSELDLDQELAAGQVLRVPLSEELRNGPPGSKHAVVLHLQDTVLAGQGQVRRHQLERTLEIAVIESRSVAFALLPPDRRASLDSGELAWPPLESAQHPTFGSREPLRVETRTQVPHDRLELVLVLRAEDGSPLEGSPGPRSLTTGGERLVSVPDELLGGSGGRVDGSYLLHVDAYELDSDGRRAPAHPIGSADLPLSIDTQPPVLELPALPTSLVVTPTESPFPLAIPRPELEGTPVALYLTLMLGRGRLLGPQRLASNSDALGPGRSAWLVDPLQLAGSSDWEDGTHRLELWARDRADNRNLVGGLDFELARLGPDLELSSPKDFVGSAGRWPKRGRGLAPVEVRALDANGLASLSCTLVRSATRVPETYRPDLGGRTFLLLPAGDDQLGSDLTDVRRSWGFDPDEGWSEADDVYVCLAATDTSGAASYKNVGPFRLPVVVERYPERAGNMWLVEGNSEQDYLFKGRDPESENTSFDDVGLPPIWVASGQAKAGETESPWALRVPAGALRPYYLDEVRVSVGEFLRFLEDPRGGYSQTSNWRLEVRPSLARRDALVLQLQRRDPGSPVTGVSFAEAHAFATSLDKRLPSLLELEFAARGGTRYRAWSWDARGVEQGDDQNPWRRIHGLSSGAEWSSSPASWEAGESAPSRPWAGSEADFALFLPRTEVDLARAEEFWIRGSLPGAGTREDQGLRHDFGALDAAPARGWSDPRVGFRCARDAQARRAEDAQRELER